MGKNHHYRTAMTIAGFILITAMLVLVGWQSDQYRKANQCKQLADTTQSVQNNH